MQNVALIGLGVIGTPIAHRLYLSRNNHFYLVANKERKQKLLQKKIKINGDSFAPKIISDKTEIDGDVDLLIVCVKNYDLDASLSDIQNIVTEKTVILPLQNGIFAHHFLKKNFITNMILQGYVQGPNTERICDGFQYKNSGVLHIGSEKRPDIAQKIHTQLISYDVEVVYEPDIQYMIWKKWMLNVAGNSITALTGADYSLFKIGRAHV